MSEIQTAQLLRLAMINAIRSNNHDQATINNRNRPKVVYCLHASQVTQCLGFISPKKSLFLMTLKG